MKKLILVMTVVLTATLAMANGWDGPTFTGGGLGTLDSLWCIGTARIGGTLSVTGASTFSSGITQSKTTVSGEADGTRHNSFTITQSSNPASSAEITGAYFAFNRAFGGNPTYVNNAVEGVARQTGIDSAGSGTIRGGYFRTYTTGFVKTQMGLDVSARTGSDAICRGGTGFFGARIYMAPYFATGFEDSVTNFHGLWIYNESTTNKINNGIRINDAGTTGYDTLINLNGATASIDIIGHSGHGLIDSASAGWVSNNNFYGDFFAPRTIGTGQLGTAGNAWNSFTGDTVNALAGIKGTLGKVTVIDSLQVGKIGLTTSNLYNDGGYFRTNLTGFKGNNLWLLSGHGFNTTAGGSFSADSFKVGATATDSVFAYLTAGKKVVVVADTLKVAEGLKTDSTAYVLKRIFMRNDSLFFVVNADTFRVVKK